MNMPLVDSPEAVVEAIDYVLGMADQVAVKKPDAQFVDPSKQPVFDDEQRHIGVLSRLRNSLAREMSDAGERQELLHG